MKENGKRRRSPAVIVAAVSVLAGHAASGSATAAARTDEGCAALAAAVTEGVGEAIARRLVAPGSTPVLPGRLPGKDTARRCGTVAATSSAAYAKTLRSFGIDVDWGNEGPPDPRDYCRSHHLDVCKPSPIRGPLALSAGIDRLVSDSWAAVQAALRRQMPLGVASDFAWFRPAELGETLAIATDAMLGVPNPVLLPAVSEQNYRE